MASDTAATRTWPELAIGLYERLTERNAEIAYQFEQLEVRVPSDASEQAARAPWTVDGTVRIRTRDRTDG